MTSPTSISRSRRGFAALGVLALIGGACLASPAQAQDTGKPITLNLQNAPVVLVLKSLFKSAGKNFTIDQNVSGPVNVDLTNVPFDTALNAVLQSAYPPLQAPQDTPGVYHVELASSTPTTTTGPTNPPIPTTVPSTDADPKTYYPIRLKYFDPYEMALLIAALSQKTATYVDPSGSFNSGGQGGSQGGYGGRQGGQGGFGVTSGGGGFGGGGFGTSGGGGFGGTSGGFGGGGFGGGGFR